jgi:hypothetical protein
LTFYFCRESRTNFKSKVSLFGPNSWFILVK